MLWAGLPCLVAWVFTVHMWLWDMGAWLVGDIHILRGECSEEGGGWVIVCHVE